MKKIFSFFVFFAGTCMSFQSQASSLSLDNLNRSCQSQGELDGRIVYLDFYKVSKTSYTAVFSKAKNTSIQAKKFLVVQNIQQDTDSFEGRYNFYDKSGFSLVPDSEDLASTNYQLTWVNFVYKGELLKGSFSCNHSSN